MKDEEKPQEQHTEELAELRQRIAKLEAAEGERRRAEEALRERRPFMISSQMLSQIDLFAGVPEGQLAAIAEISEEITCKKGESIFQEGSKAEHIYILLDGEVAIQVSLISRPENITVSIINLTHQSFGWSGIVPPHSYTATAFCQTDCRLLAIYGQKLIQVLQQDLKSGFVVMQRIAEVISRRLRNSRLVLLKNL